MSDLIEDRLDDGMITDDNIGVVVYFRNKDNLKFVALAIDKDEFMKVGLSGKNYLQGKPIEQIQEAIRKATDE